MHINPIAVKRHKKNFFEKANRSLDNLVGL